MLFEAIIFKIVPEPVKLKWKLHSSKLPCLLLPSLPQMMSLATSPIFLYRQQASLITSTPSTAMRNRALLPKATSTLTPILMLTLKLKHKQKLMWSPLLILLAKPKVKLRLIQSLSSTLTPCSAAVLMLTALLRNLRVRRDWPASIWRTPMDRTWMSSCLTSTERESLTRLPSLKWSLLSSTRPLLK